MIYLPYLRRLIKTKVKSSDEQKICLLYDKSHTQGQAGLPLVEASNNIYINGELIFFSLSYLSYLNNNRNTKNHIYFEVVDKSNRPSL